MRVRAPTTAAGGDSLLLSRIEDAGLNASAPPQQRWLDGWLVRFSPGKAKRARCIQPVAAGRLAVEQKLRACEAVYAEARLPLIVRITPFAEPADLDLRLERLGMLRFDDTRVMLRAALDELAAPVLPRETAVVPLALEHFAQRVGAFRQSPLAQRQAHAQRLLQAPVSFRAFELRVDQEPVACGQFAVEGDLVGLYDVFTAPALRGRGHASLLCRQMLVSARSLGATTAYLQVDADNAPARRVYHGLGFADGYAYHYRSWAQAPG